MARRLPSVGDMATEKTTLAAETPGLERRRDTIRGPVIAPDDAGYDAARAILNGAIDCRPACIARCAGVADVVAAVRFARERVADNYGAHYERLCAVKGIHDPDNVFHVNQHIAPASGR